MKKAFTLIELLVVVLIIGILAAVAVPQYRVAVGKTRFANLRKVAATYVKAAQVYHTEFSTWPNSFDVLGVQAPAGSEIVTSPNGMNSTCMITHDMYCCINGHQEGAQSASVVCGTTDYSLVYKYLLETNYPMCSVKETWMEQICKNLGGVGRETNSEPQTPEGAKPGYINYKIRQ